MTFISFVYKVYQMGDVQVHALQVVSLAVQEGEYVAFIGASGSGRSTLLVVAVVGGLLGILFGFLVSRSLAASLNHMAEAARGTGGGDFSRRVEPVGSDDMLDLAYAFNEMAGQLEQAEIQRRNLMADVAHELRTPLSVLQGNLRAILDDVYVLDKS